MESHAQKEKRALGVLDDPRVQLTINTFMQTSKLVSLVGDGTARALLLHTTAYHKKHIVPFLEQGKRLNVHLNLRGFSTLMANQRRGRYRRKGVFPCDPSSEAYAFALALCGFAWRMETRLWEADAVCLKGLDAGRRDEVYLAVMHLLEIRWRAKSALPADLQGEHHGAVDRSLNEWWARGLFPEGRAVWDADLMKEKQGVLAKVRAPHYVRCRCNERKREVFLKEGGHGGEARYAGPRSLGVVFKMTQQGEWWQVQDLDAIKEEEEEEDEDDDV